MRTLVAALTASALLALAAPAARADLVLHGRGWGHGVGLSQYGAYGYALLEGREHRWILEHYFPGTSLGRAAPVSMRVLLSRSRAPRLCGLRRLRDATGRRVGLSEARTYAVRASGSAGLRLIDARSGRTRVRVSAPATVSGGETWCLRGVADNGVRDGAYRGRARLVRDGRRVLVVNSVGLESYLQGVVPAEVPSTWPAAALRAQAVVARSYALRSRRPAAAYDVFADVRSQVYSGLGSEVPAASAAVRATRAEVVTSAGAVAQTFFFSTSGGRTAANEEVWGGLPIGYLRSVEDPHDDLSPYHRWTARLSDRTLRRDLRDLRVGRVRRVRVAAHTASGRAALVQVEGSRGDTEVSAARLQALLGLRSTWFRVGG